MSDSRGDRRGRFVAVAARLTGLPQRPTTPTFAVIVAVAMIAAAALAVPAAIRLPEATGPIVGPLLLLFLGAALDAFPVRQRDTMYSLSSAGYVTATMLNPTVGLALIGIIGGTGQLIGAIANPHPSVPLTRRVGTLRTLVNAAVTIVQAGLGGIVAAMIAARTGAPFVGLVLGVVLADLLGGLVSSTISRAATGKRTRFTELSGNIPALGILTSASTGALLLAVAMTHPTVLPAALPAIIALSFVTARANDYSRAVATDATTRLRSRNGFIAETSELDHPDATTMVVRLHGLDGCREALGDGFADAVLQEVAGVFETLNPSMFTGRVAPDILATICLADPRLHAVRMREELTRRWTVMGIPVVLQAEIGVAAPHPDDTRSDRGDRLVRAEAALGAGPGAITINAEPNATDAEALARTTRLFDAIRSGGIDAYYQPIVEAFTGRVVAVEALARWYDRDELVTPGKLLPLVRRMGMDSALTAAMVDRVMADLALWARDGLILSANINVAPSDLTQPDLEQSLVAASARHEVPLSRIVIEMTEESAILDPVTTTKTLERLREFGCRSAVDDFGTGQSSLARITRFPFDTIKLDRALVTNVHTDRPARVVLTHLVRLAHDLGLSVTAEGVEHDGEREALRLLGVDMLQGFGIARPAPPDRISGLVAELGQFPTDAAAAHGPTGRTGP
ncbi:diguanylate cyclase/phosphodiesterase (GGDEF & EAL domains) with PAS/PAC sensor(s) (plasmid) [Euzebya pacifica]|uniref:Diguanylate cyclase/phosphodiesterase (GGDEF & EAL domains) with PAS/PAC sensor(S) n=1 Tax=Euzebya pacifica TaxID=1608957 RepID=A0A346Y6B2_9ACTN|nr:EAL domain-containing protein [Euzebya pacifica]AXV10009.1 diguanylate cyclase/phosphodiesterase (GGDEF & EAL domains) with PAS/PAC sensor(s) [Euzebya pacifica]